MKYVVLLRGVNVGGNRRVPQAEFRNVLEHLGFRDVVIYINSGNAVITSDSEPQTAHIQAALEAHFGFEIATLVLPAETIQAIATAIPDEWTNDSLTAEKTGSKSDVIYLFDVIDHPDVIEKIGYLPDRETMKYVNGAVLTTITRLNQTRGSLQKVIGTPLYKQMTIRTITTAKKLAELTKETGV